jgi:hypothetical protein
MRWPFYSHQRRQPEFTSDILQTAVGNKIGQKRADLVSLSIHPLTTFMAKKRPAVSNSFKLFNAASYSGTFANAILPALQTSLVWNTSALNTNGVLSVMATPHPVIVQVKITGNGLVFSGSTGAGYASFYLLGATNFSTPVSNWARLLTNQFDAGGNFNFTNLVNPDWPQGFYLLQIP